MNRERGEKAYHGGDVFAAARDLGCSWRDVLDYSANINPLGPPPGLKKRLFEGFELTIHYPDPYALEWRARLAEGHGLEPGNILAGNGSTALMYLLARVVAPRRPAIVAPAFGEYDRAATLSGARPAYADCSPKDDFDVTEKVLDKAFRLRPDLVFIANPTSPAGRLISPEILDRAIFLAEKNDALVALDEAFLDFTQAESLATRAGRTRRLIAIRSMTKFFALPGLRLGYLTGHRSLVDRLAAAAEPWAVNSLALAAGHFCLDQAEYAARTRRLIARERDRLTRSLENLGIGRVVPSAANYLLVGLEREGLTETGLCRAMKDQGVLIRPCSSFRGLEGYVRFAVKGPKQNDRFIEALRQALPQATEDGQPRRKT